jgi:formate hydrogenlyase subunit 6/NADH:ubiquinone oxidoreductase subunit I
MGKSNDTSEKKSRKAMAVGDRAILPEGARTIPIYIMGKKYEVPETLTIMKAMEFAGFQFVRGCGCRGGICGACSTVYRKPDDYKLQVGLACQTVVEPDMYLTQMPFFPANRAPYRLEDLEGKPEEIFKLYPEVFRCVACNACTKACPMDVKVLDYVSAIKQGNITKAAQISFDCVQCGLCASRCVGELPQYHFAQLARRMYGKIIAPKSKHLEKRVEEIASGKYGELLKKLTQMDQKELEKLYIEREREPDTSTPGEWMPEETDYL